jgi:hypothetical protein
MIPIVMVVLSTLNHPESLGKHHRGGVLLASTHWPTYPSAYDKFLIVVGLVFNVLTVWFAWKWV